MDLECYDRCLKLLKFALNCLKWKLKCWGHLLPPSCLQSCLSVLVLPVGVCTYVYGLEMAAELKRGLFRRWGTRPVLVGWSLPSPSLHLWRPGSALSGVGNWIQMCCFLLPHLWALVLDGCVLISQHSKRKGRGLIHPSYWSSNILEWRLVLIPSFVSLLPVAPPLLPSFWGFFLCVFLHALCRYVTILCLSLWNSVLFIFPYLAVLQNTLVVLPVILLVAFLCYRWLLPLCFWLTLWQDRSTGQVLFLPPAMLGLAVFPLCGSRDLAGSVAQWALRGWVPAWDLLGEPMSYNHSGKRSITADIDLIHGENRKGRNSNQVGSAALPLHGRKSAHRKYSEE